MRYQIIAIAGFLLGIVFSGILMRPQIGWLVTAEYIPTDQEIVLAQYKGMEWPMVVYYTRQGPHGELWLEASNFGAGREMPAPDTWRRIK